MNGLRRPKRDVHLSLRTPTMGAVIRPLSGPSAQTTDAAGARGSRVAGTTRGEQSAQRTLGTQTCVGASGALGRNAPCDMTGPPRRVV
jgi:hypothetical protein